MAKKREIQAAVLIVTRDRDGKTTDYLVIGKEKWDGLYSLPISKLRDNESKENAANRIIADGAELGLSTTVEKPEFLGTTLVEKKSKSVDEETQYTYHVFLLKLPVKIAEAVKGPEKKEWISWEALKGSKLIPGLALSPTVSPTIFDMLERGYLPMSRKPTTERFSFIKSVCDGLIEILRHGHAVLLSQTETRGVTIVGKADTLTFDMETQNALFNKVREMGHKIAERHGVSIRLKVQGEEDAIESQIGDAPELHLVITVDPCDGSGNYKGYLETPPEYRDLLPMPDTGISIAAQINPGTDTRYVAGAAIEMQRGTVYSAYKMGDRYICRINDREIPSQAFSVGNDLGKPKINVPFYSNRDVDFMRELTQEFQAKLNAKVYPGRCRASIVDMIRMLGGDCHAMVDVRALRANEGAALKAWDVCGMIPFFEGLGWHVSDEAGNPIAWENYKEPVCIVVCRHKKLFLKIIETIETIQNRGVPIN